MLKKIYIFRSAITGRIVTKKYALDNPDITVKERKRPRTRLEEKIQINKRKDIKKAYESKQIKPDHTGWSFTR